MICICKTNPWKLGYATGVHTSNLAAKSEFIALKVEVDKSDIRELVKVPTGLNNLKANVDDLDAGRLKTVLNDLKKLSEMVDKEVVKNTKFNTLNTKVIKFEKKIPDVSTLIQTNQYNTDK